MNRDIIFNHRKIIKFFFNICNVLNFRNVTLRRKGNIIKIGAVLKKNCKIYIKGKKNVIEIGDFSRLCNVKITINGNDNIIKIGERCYFNGAEFAIEDSCNEINIASHTSVSGKTGFSAIEGTKINIGSDCMFSANIDVRTGDSHSIVDMDGRRTNISKNVNIGNHVWVCRNVSILKGSEIPNYCILGTGAIVSSVFKEDHSLIAGIPGRIVKKDINWLRERI